MKGAEKFEKAIDHTLTEQEITEIRRLIRKLAANHKNTKWWKFDNAVRRWVNVELSALLSEESFAEAIAEEDEECLDL